MNTSVKHVIADSSGFTWAALSRRWETLLLAVLAIVVGVGIMYQKALIET